MRKLRPWKEPDPCSAFALFGFPGPLDPPPCPQHGLYQLPTPHSWAPVVKFQGCRCHGNSQLTGPLLLGFSTSPGRRQRGPPSPGGWRGWGWGREEVRPSRLLFVFQRRKWKRHKVLQQMLLSYPRDSGKDRSGLLGWGQKSHPESPSQPCTWRTAP